MWENMVENIPTYLRVLPLHSPKR